MGLLGPLCYYTSRSLLSFLSHLFISSPFHSFISLFSSFHSFTSSLSLALLREALGLRVRALRLRARLLLRVRHGHGHRVGHLAQVALHDCDLLLQLELLAAELLEAIVDLEELQRLGGLEVLERLPHALLRLQQLLLDVGHAWRHGGKMSLC